MSDWGPMLKDANDEYKDRDPVEMEMEIASIETGLPLTTVLDADACSEIAEALGLDEEAIQHIHRRLCHVKAREDFRWVFAMPANSVFHSLKTIADELSEIATELEHDNGTLQTLLELALCYSGQIEEHPEVCKILRPLKPLHDDARARSSDRETEKHSCNPGRFFDACLQKERESVVSNFPLAVIESLQEAVDRLLALTPKQPKGSPGKSYRNAVIHALARAYEEIFDEAPTCSDNGRFIELCQHVFQALGMNDEGLESAVQRALRSRKEN